MIDAEGVVPADAEEFADGAADGLARAGLSLFLLYHDDKNINLKDEFFKRGVLVIDGYDFKGLDSSAARVRLPKKRDFPKLLRAITEINQL